MIKTADEFIKLRNENDSRATMDTADISIWKDIIHKYPEYKSWVIHNKTIQLEILEYLATDSDPRIRGEVARKRKINDKIFDLLKNDSDENVRFALISNTKLPAEMIAQIKTEDSDWLKDQLAQKLKSKN